MYNPEYVTTIRADELAMTVLPLRFFEGRRRWSRREVVSHRGVIVSAYYVAENEPDYPEILHVISA